jgi:hypothetical protein
MRFSLYTLGALFLFAYPITMLFVMSGGIDPLGKNSNNRPALLSVGAPSPPPDEAHARQHRRLLRPATVRKSSSVD